MHVDFECSGGYGGLQLSFRGDTSDLPADVAGDLERAVADSGVWDLTEADIPAEGDGPPDVFTYRLALREGDKQTTLSVTDVTAPESLRPLLGMLRKLAVRRGREAP
jgi:hypothetical protein